MHAKPDLRVVLEWTIAGSGSVIADVIRLTHQRMTQPRNTLDAAIRTYLGGDWETSAIQVGLREERLTQSFGTEASALKLQIEAILADALRYARDRTKSDTMVDPTCLWVAEMHPSLSDVACRKIESDTTFQLEH